MKRAIIATCLVAALLGGSVSRADAHNPDTSTFGSFYRFRTQLDMWFQQNTAWQLIPGLTDRVVNGMESWNFLQPADNIHFASRDFKPGMSESPCLNAINVNGLFWGDASGHTGDPYTLAITYVCSGDGTYPGDPRRIKNAVTIFDGDATNWSLNPSSVGIPGTRDLWSIATHELGHSLGLFDRTTAGSNGVAARHWDSPSTGLAQTGQVNGSTLCPSTSERHTVCAVYISGSTMWRSPASHDQHTVYNKYGPGYP